MEDDNRSLLRSRIVTAVCTLTVIAVFAVGAMLVVTVGMRVYEHVVLSVDSDFELRTSLSYVATRIRQAGGSSDIMLENISGTDVLALTEWIEDIETVTYMYHRDGGLYEYMTLKGESFDRDAGFLTMEVDGFTMKRDGDSITLRAVNSAGDTESLTVLIRNGEGEALK